MTKNKKYPYFFFKRILCKVFLYSFPGLHAKNKNLKKKKEGYFLQGEKSSKCLQLASPKLDTAVCLNDQALAQDLMIIS